jgi:hypothetical protein
MALKFKYQSKAEVPEVHAALYVERDGAFVLDAEGAVEKSKVDEFRTNNLALKNQLADLNAKFEGIDPDSVKTLLAEKAKLEEEKLIKDGEVEKLVENRTKKILGEMEKRVVSAEQSAATLSAQLLEKEIERNVVEAATKLGLRATAIPDIKLRARSVFKISGGAISAVESDGQTPVFGRDGVTPLTFDEWVSRQAVEAPHLFETSAGGGAVGHGSGGAGKHAGKNPFAQASWNLTEQMKLQKTDPSLAARLKASA